MRTEERDRRMKEAMRGELEAIANGGEGVRDSWKDNPNQQADRAKNLELFCYDADKEAGRWWEENRGRLSKEIGDTKEARL